MVSRTVSSSERLTPDELEYVFRTEMENILVSGESELEMEDRKEELMDFLWDSSDWETDQYEQYETHVNQWTDIKDLHQYKIDHPFDTSMYEEEQEEEEEEENPFAPPSPKAKATLVRQPQTLVHKTQGFMGGQRATSTTNRSSVNLQAR
eukprot:CFRG6291T1